MEPLKLVDWDEMTSDFAIQRWAFAGLAAHQTEKLQEIYLDPVTNNQIVYQNDWSWMVDLETRDGFENYGATVYFDENKKLVQIYYAGVGKNITKTMVEEWEHAKWVFKCSAISGVTLRDHLVGLHFMASNFLAASEAQYLNGTHPIRRMLRPYTYGTVSINLGAIKTLAVQNGILHRASAFTWDSLQEGFKISFDQNRFVGTIDQFLKKNHMLVSIQSDAVSNVAVIIVRIVFIGSFLFYCLLLNHSFQTNPNRITNCF